MKNTMEIAGALVRRRRGVLLSSARAVANPRRGHSVAAIRVAPSTGAEIGCGGAGASDLTQTPIDALRGLWRGGRGRPCVA